MRLRISKEEGMKPKGSKRGGKKGGSKSNQSISLDQQIENRKQLLIGINQELN